MHCQVKWENFEMSLVNESLIFICLMLFSVITPAHEMTPTYPKMEPSHVKGVYKTTMQMFNKRVEVEYYEIQVYDADWKPIQFVTSYSILKIEYLSKVEFDLYVKEEDAGNVEYICSTSKIKKIESTSQTISSRICSKVNKEDKK